MRRFVLFAVLCALSLPVGLSITGCSHDYGSNFCSGYQSGPGSNAVAKITLQPSTYGISLNYGQVYSVSSPVAVNCKGSPVTVSSYNYAINKLLPGNLYLADISPSGEVCGGTWNRNSGNGIPDYTTCIPPQPGSAIYNLHGGVVYATATAGNATSNPVPVYVHPPVTSVVLQGAGTTQNGCVSQNQTSALTSIVYSGTTVLPSSGPDNVVGHLTYSAENPSVVTFDQNGVATAAQPGSTIVTATVAQASSTAGYFFTCPPASIQLRVGNTNDTSVTVNPNNVQPLTATVLDTQHNPITGLALTYTSTSPVTIPVGSTTGSVAPVYPGDAAITAQCLPALCNPSPQDQIGNLSTGMPVTSNPVEVTTPGPSLNVMYMASPQSSNFVPIDFQSGTVGAPIRLPYQPNSMVMSERGNYLYFGSSHENMIVSISPTAGATLTTQTPGVPGTVLAVAPDDSLEVIHDPCRQLFYLFTPPQGNAAASELSFGAPGSFPAGGCNSNNEPNDPTVEVNPPYTAAFTQDSQTLYIVGNGSLFTYSKFTGWHTCTDNGQTGNCPTGPTGLAVTVPGVGAFAGGSSTTAFGYCATGPNNSGAQTAGPPPTGVDPNAAQNPTAYYPLAASVGVATDQLAATVDGFHILGANVAGTFTDINPTIPNGMCPLNSGLKFPTNVSTQTFDSSNVQSIDQVLASPNSQLAFLTYLPKNPTTGDTLPVYSLPACTPPAGGPVTCPAGTLSTITLNDNNATPPVPAGGPIGAPVGGVFSPDTTTFYVSTSGDDLVHFINTNPVPSPTNKAPFLSDTAQINPGLSCSNTIGTTIPGTNNTPVANPWMACTAGQPVPALFLASRPRPTQGASTAARKN